jgi:hypothetical protein
MAEDPARIRIEAEREAIYAEIHDLDHDHETGKLEEDDYGPMREALRARAIELLRAERNGAAAAPPDEASTVQPSTAATAEPDAAASKPHSARFCPHCGEGLKPDWRFCSHCGGRLDALEETSG